MLKEFWGKVGKFERITNQQPEVFWDDKQALVTVNELYQDKNRPGYVLPLHMDVGRFGYGAQITRRFEGHFKDRLPWPGPYRSYPVVRSQFMFDGNQVDAFLLSEDGVVLGEKEYGQEGSMTCYRYDASDLVKDILEHGYYQLPGRRSFYSEPTERSPWLNEQTVVIAFDIDLKDLLLAPYGNYVSLAIPDNFRGHILPSEIKNPLSQLRLARFGERVSLYSSNVHRRQVLLSGELTGLLVRVSSDRINRGVSLETSRQLCQQGKIREENLAKLEQLLS